MLLDVCGGEAVKNLAEFPNYSDNWKAHLPIPRGMTRVSAPGRHRKAHLVPLRTVRNFPTGRKASGAFFWGWGGPNGVGIGPKTPVFPAKTLPSPCFMLGPCGQFSALFTGHSPRSPHTCGAARPRADVHSYLRQMV